MLYSTFDNKFIIKGTIVAVDPIHIGAASSSSLNPVEVDNAVLKDSNGDPVIPGASLKGVVRSQFESILKLIDGKKVCNINDENKNCITEKRVKEIKDENLSLQQRAEKFYALSCDVCRLFGGRVFAGKLHFKDCSYIGDKPCQFEKRDGVGIDRETGAAMRSAKFDYEIIPKGTKFDCEIIAENLDEEQKKYLALIVRLLEGSGIAEGDYLSIGGKTTRGLGRFVLTDVKITEITPEKMRERVERLMNTRLEYEEE